jgi:signal transduction histidine kinase
MDDLMALMALLDLTDWAYFSLDPSGRLVEVSDHLAQLLATEPDALVGVSLASLCIPPYDSLLSEHLLQLAAPPSGQVNADRLHLFLSLQYPASSEDSTGNSETNDPPPHQGSTIPVELVALFPTHPQVSAERVGKEGTRLPGAEVAVVGLMRPTTPEPPPVTEEITRLTEAERQHAKQLQALMQAGQWVAAAKDLDMLLSYLVNLLHEEFHYPYADVFLLDDDETQFVLRASQPPVEQGAVRFHIGEPGIIKTVINNGEPALINDVTNHPHHVPCPRHPNVKSELAVPLTASNRVVGILIVQSDARDAFSLDDMVLLQALADYAAVAVENATLLAERDQRMAELAALNQIGMLLVSPRQLMDTLETIIRHIIALFQVEAASLMLIEDGRLHFKVASGTHIDQISPYTLEIGQGIAGWAVEHNQTVRVNNVAADPRHYPGIDQAINFDTRSLIAAPLRIAKYSRGTPESQGEDQVLGVIEIINRLDGRPFTRNDEVLIEFIASSAAVVIENVRLFNELQRRLDEMSALLDTSRAITTLELQAVFDIIVERVSTTLDAEQAIVYLLDDEQQLVPHATNYDLQEDELKQLIFPLSQGTVGRIAETRQPLRVDAAQNDPRFLMKASFSDQVRCTLGVPLIVQSELIGVLEVVNKRNQAHFTPADEDLLSAFARMAAIAIEKARLHEETSQRLAEVSTLYTLANQVTTVLDLDRILEATVTIINHALDCQRCCLYLQDPETGDLAIKAHSGWRRREYETADLEFVGQLSRQVLRERRPVNLTDIPPPEGRESALIRSLLVVPLITKNALIGTLSIDDHRPEAFGPAEGRLLTIAAAQVAVAIENARLLRSLRDRAIQLEQTLEDLRELNRHRTEFVQNVSHELRTPLTFIKGYVQLILEESMGEINYDVRQALKVVDERTEAVIRLVNDIISLEQVEMGMFEFQPISLAEVAANSVKGAAITAQKAHLQIELELADDLPAVNADAGRLGQVFDNLLGNAIKFSPAGSIITVRVLRDGDFVRAEVEDQGIGIPADKLDRIFDRFYQVDGSTTRRYSGTGLGLAIVKTIVEAHGGQVIVESEFGVGSTFSFILPIPTDG